MIGAEDKPIILVLHDENCDNDIHCREIRREFSTHEDLIKISANFHMINMMGYEEHANHWDSRIVNPWYTPRFFFLEDHVSNPFCNFKHSNADSLILIIFRVK